MDKLEELRELLAGFSLPLRVESSIYEPMAASIVPVDFLAGGNTIAHLPDYRSAVTIVEAVNALPNLLDEITRLNAEVEEAKAGRDQYADLYGRRCGDLLKAQCELAAANALIDEMVEGLEEGASWFEEYSRQHYAKARTAPDGREQHGREVKGTVNAERAKFLRALILKARGKDANVG